MGTDSGNMSFWDHLEVLRWVLLRCVLALLLAAVAWFIVLPHVFDGFVLGPTRGDFFLYRWLGGLFSLVSPSSAGGDGFSATVVGMRVATQFITHIRISLLFALVTVFPYLLFELWRFVKPALYPHEKRKIRFGFAFGGGMFYLGCAVGYGLVFPLTFRFLADYRISGSVDNLLSLDSYIGTFVSIIFILGLCFELPMLTMVLSRLGILSRAFLKRYRRHAAVVLLVLAAVITPTGDPFTLTVVFLPLYLLYEMGILLAIDRQETAGE